MQLDEDTIQRLALYTSIAREQFEKDARALSEYPPVPRLQQQFERQEKQARLDYNLITNAESVIVPESVRIVTDPDYLANLLRETEAAHKASGDADINWAGWYARYIAKILTS